MVEPRVTYDQVKGVFALIPACTTPDGSSIYATDTVDTVELSRLVDNLIRDGANGIVTTGSVGECHTLLWEEHKKLIEAAVNAAKNRVPVFTGTTSLNTRESIMKTKFAESAGADGVMNGVPMYLPSSVENAVQYYRDLAEACPAMGIMIYHNPSVFRVIIPPRAFAKLTDMPNIVAMKETHAMMSQIMGDLRLIGNKISVLVIDSMMYPTMMFGVRGCWSTRASMGPWPVTSLYKACGKQDWATAAKISADIDEASEPIDWETFVKFQADMNKIAHNEAGYCKAGPNRPPFRETPQWIVEHAKKQGRNWTDMAKKYK